MEEQIRQLLRREFGLSVLASKDPIFSAGLLDSLSSIRLVMAMEQDFGVQVTPLDISLDDIDSIDAIASTVVRLRG